MRTHTAIAGQITDNPVTGERFVPHGPVLERAAAVVCHAGMGIVNKAVSAAVPIVAVPFGRDQPEVARRVVECGAGVAVRARRVGPARLQRAFRAALELTDSARSASARLHAAGGPERFADAAEEIIGTVAARSRCVAAR